MIRHRDLLSLFAAATLIGAAAATPAFAAPTEEPAAPVAAPVKKPDAKSDTKASDTKSDAKPSDAKSADPKPADVTPAPEKKSEREFRDGYKLAYDAIYNDKNYAAGIKILRGLGHDDHADVANLIGFSSRQLGRTDDAKAWYEKALASDPRHTRTWQYYGMWQIEQGNRPKAEEYLETIRAVCGTECEDFRSLTLALIGNSSY